MSTSTMTAASTSPLSSPKGPPRPLQLLDSNIPAVSNSPLSASALTSPRSSALGLSTPSPSGRTFKLGNPRRQSSISYFTSDHTRSSSLRSPVTPVGKPSPRRSASVGVWDGEGAESISKLQRDRRSLGPLSGNKDTLPSSPTVDHGPLTLTEKHADLLHFIAQKEAKCLELRSQLAAHEAELSQLKRKWERIVSRGMDRAYSSPGVAGSPSSAVSSIIPSARDALKEGARLLAAGLNDLSTVEQGSQSPPNSSTISPIVAPMSGFATISRASMISSSAARKAASRHEQTQSISSVSTAASSAQASTTPSSQRLSQSSASSVLSSLSLEDPIEEGSSTSTPEESAASFAPSPVQVSPSEKLLRRRSQDKSQSFARSPLSPSPLSAEASKRADISSNPRGKVKARPASIVVGSPTAPVSSWMGSVGSSVGRKWEEIQKNEAFTKSQKRASVLLSDVSQSLLSALSSPPPSTGHSPAIKPSPLAASPSGSLLDDELEQMDGPTLTLSAPLIPSVVSPSPSPTPSQKVDDDEEWNW
ncbi:hypothetical protein BDW22DRAFT_182126 [Trametopsis cervina]|nr:hypothetical protein BDW22DRAFT_182126 [Trametopsis cervina]